jgi:hypothetical protein
MPAARALASLEERTLFRKTRVRRVQRIARLDRQGAGRGQAFGIEAGDQPLRCFGLGAQVLGRLPAGEGCGLGQRGQVRSEPGEKGPVRLADRRPAGMAGAGQQLEKAARAAGGLDDAPGVVGHEVRRQAEAFAQVAHELREPAPRAGGQGQLQAVPGLAVEGHGRLWLPGSGGEDGAQEKGGCAALALGHEAQAPRAEPQAAPGPEAPGQELAGGQGQVLRGLGLVQQAQLAAEPGDGRRRRGQEPGRGGQAAADLHGVARGQAGRGDGQVAVDPGDLGNDGQGLARGEGQVGEPGAVAVRDAPGQAALRIAAQAAVGGQAAEKGPPASGRFGRVGQEDVGQETAARSPLAAIHGCEVAAAPGLHALLDVPGHELDQGLLAPVAHGGEDQAHARAFGLRRADHVLDALGDDDLDPALGRGQAVGVEEALEVALEDGFGPGVHDCRAGSGGAHCAHIPCGPFDLFNPLNPFNRPARRGSRRWPSRCWPRPPRPWAASRWR